MTFAFHGIGVSKGIAIGKAHIVAHDELDIPEYRIRHLLVEDEIKRFEDALALATQRLRMVRKYIPDNTRGDIVAFIDTHLLMMSDVVLTDETVRLIKELRCNAEWALKQQRDALVSVFESMNDNYLRTRKNDIDYVVNLIQRILLKHAPSRYEKPDHNLSGAIILASDLAPADTVLMQHYRIAAFATEFGGLTSHTAILAQSLCIPAVVGLQSALNYIQENDQIILDGTCGILLVEPDPLILSQYERLQKEAKSHVSKLGRLLRRKPAVTRDGTPITLQANANTNADLSQVGAAITVGASGIGLYRTEFLYMNRDAPPDEEEHYTTYMSVIKTLKSLPLTIRTLDSGADKPVDGDGQKRGVSTNPALGLRAIRLCLRETELFRTQLRAILRASASGTVRIIIPMLSNIYETRQIFHIIEDLKRELDELAIPYDTNLKIGVMIEVPAAAVCADIFAKQFDFLSLGTNDLIQYTMAMDRVDEEVSYLYDPLNLAVLRLIQNTIKAGQHAAVPVAMCGEMAGDTKYTRLLLGLGLREFSMHPSNLPEVKKIILDSDIKPLEKLANSVMKTNNSLDAIKLLQSYEATEHGV